MTINQFDNGLTRTIQHWPKWWRPIMIAASCLADPHIIGVLVAGSVLLALQIGPLWLAEAIAWSVPPMLVNGVVKQYLHRPRPDTLYVSRMRFKSFSFPSGHAFCAAVLYGLFGYAALMMMAGPWGTVVAVAFTGLVVLIGLSRVYLGAHYPTDVIGGWGFGAIALMVLVLALVP